MQAAYSAVWRKIFVSSLAVAALFIPRGASCGQTLPIEFHHPEIIRCDANCFTLNGRDAVLFGGSMHYFRVDRGDWEDRLTKMRAAGLNLIKTLVPWNWHEKKPGVFDFSDLEEFLSLTQSKGMYVQVRIGPNITGEWDAAGYPRWLLPWHYRMDLANDAKWCAYWYAHVLPVIKRHQITEGGNVILVQLDNEVGNTEGMTLEIEKSYLKMLYGLVKSAGISVPLTTNWGTATHDNTDPVLSQILDWPDFNYFDSIPDSSARLDEARLYKPNNPLGSPEFPGFLPFTYLKQWADQLQRTRDASLLAAYAQVALERGSAFLNFYMFSGATNREFAARDFETSYDYSCPIAEDGELRDKYYTVRGFGTWLEQNGAALARSTLDKTDLSRAKPATVVMRRNGPRGFLFVRANNPSVTPLRFVYKDPENGQGVEVPQLGGVDLSGYGEVGESRILSLNVPLQNGVMRYATSQVAFHTLFGREEVIVLSAKPGVSGEACFRFPASPAMSGDITDARWNPSDSSLVVSYRHSERLRSFRLQADGERGADLTVFVTPTALAESSIVLRTEGGEFPLITNARLVRSVRPAQSHVAAEIDVGQTEALLFVPGFVPVDKLVADRIGPEPILENAQDIRAFRIAPWQMPAVAPVTEYRGSRVVDFDRLPASPYSREALEQTGKSIRGYSIYQARFSADPSWRAFLELYPREDDVYISEIPGFPHDLFINDTYVPDLSSRRRSEDTSLHGLIAPGENHLAVVCSDFGKTNNQYIWTDSGLRAISVGPRKSESQEITGWSLAQIDFSHPEPLWKAESSPASAPGFLIQSWSLDGMKPPPPGIFQTWFLRVDASKDAVFYLNGKFLGHVSPVGLQRDFYLPGSYLSPDGKNDLRVVSINGSPGAVSAIRVVSNPQTSARTIHLEVTLR